MCGLKIWLLKNSSMGMTRPRPLAGTSTARAWEASPFGISILVDSRLTFCMDALLLNPEEEKAMTEWIWEEIRLLRERVKRLESENAQLRDQLKAKACSNS